MPDYQNPWDDVWLALDYARFESHKIAAKHILQRILDTNGKNAISLFKQWNEENAKGNEAFGDYCSRSMYLQGRKETP